MPFLNFGIPPAHVAQQPGRNLLEKAPLRIFRYNNSERDVYEVIDSTVLPLAIQDDFVLITRANYDELLQLRAEKSCSERARLGKKNFSAKFNKIFLFNLRDEPYNYLCANRC